MAGKWKVVGLGARIPSLALRTCMVCFLAGPAVAEDALDRLSRERLEAVHQAVVKLRGQRRAVERAGAFREYRANLHVHSALSHDSRGSIEEIVAAARKVGTQVVMFSEHPAGHYDFYEDGHQGDERGVLLVPGAETKGLLVWPRRSLRGVQLPEAQPEAQALSDLLRGQGGLAFLSHLEERMDWEIRGLTGVEIYNTHADLKDEKRLLSSMRNPLWLVGAAALFKRYPQEAFSALHDYPADYLRRWDELCRKSPHTGVAANDSHQNVGVRVRLLEGGKARVEDALGEKLLELDAAGLAVLGRKPAEAGAVLLDITLDPYEQSLRHAGTHLLMKELSREAVWDALERGRAFVAFDWMADATGFDFAADAVGIRHEMGSRVKLAGELRLVGRSPLPGRWKVLAGGKLYAEASGESLDVRVTESGVYRAELWLEIAGSERVWVLSNPIYVTGE